MRLKVLSFIFLGIIVIASSWALFVPGMFRTHDFVHGARIAEMARGISDGQLPVRWSAHFGYGFGMPLFQFYAPLPYYVGAFVYLLTNDLVSASKLLFFLPNLLIALGCFYLGREITKKDLLLPLLFAALVTLAPYRALNLFVRGAVAEAWAQAFYPWIVLGLVQTLRERRGWFILTFSLVGMFLSHNISTVLFLGIFFVLFIFLFMQIALTTWLTRTKLLHRFLAVSSAFVVAVGLSAFYLFPAYLEKDFVQLSSILSGYFSYEHHFLYIRQFLTPFWGFGGSGWGPEDTLSFFLGFPQLLALSITVLGTLLLFLKGMRERNKFISYQELLFPSLLWALLLISLYLTLLKARWIWDLIPFFSFIQFPWRWLSVATFLLGLLTLVIIYHLHAAVLPRKIQSSICLGLLLFSLGNAWYFKPEFWLDRSETFYYSDSDRIRVEMSGILPDFLPAGIDHQIEPHLGDLCAGNDWCTQVVTKSDEHLLKITTAPTESIVLPLAFYPGVRAEIDGSPAKILPTPEGMVQVMTGNKSDFALGILYDRTLLRSVSDLVSGLSWLTMFFVFLWHNSRGLFT